MEVNQIIHGDNLEILKTFADNSIDSIVTDPPYGLSFMNKHWDYDVPSVELWKECLRVLKPGGHLLSFAGTRTYHRMTVRIEDAGFEIRDMISWIYGSGFPKSLDIGKAIDKMKGVEREVIGTKKSPDGRDYSIENAVNKGEFGGENTFKKSGMNLNKLIATKGNSEYEGWGTALKPACEPICVARKPVNGTIANNVLEYGTGGINIDGCRIGTSGARNNGSKNGTLGSNSIGYYKPTEKQDYNMGRFPANIIFDEIAGVMLDEMSGELGKSQGGNSRAIQKNCYNDYGKNYDNKPDKISCGFNDKGGASRFFYCAKASKAERNGGLEGFEEQLTSASEFRPNHLDKTMQGENGNPYGRWTPVKNNHPTVKPLKLMQYLVRLVTPPNGVCLDPFCGSGTTLMACVKEGFNYIGLEREADYVKIAEARIEWVKKQAKETPEQTNLFKVA